jgi:hypothetical protein
MRLTPLWVLTLLVATFVAETARAQSTSDGGVGLRTVELVIDVEARVADLARLSPNDRRRYCDTAFASAPVERVIQMSGQIDRANSNSQTFLNGLYGLISAYFHSPEERYDELAHTLHEAAAANAYTELAPFYPAEIPRYNGWNEPAYQQALLLVPISIAYLITRKAEPTNAEFHKQIHQWGDAIFKSASSGRDDFRGTYEGVDRLSMKASGFAYWGNVTNNRRALALANDGYQKVLRSIGLNGSDTVWSSKGGSRLYYANMTWGPMTLTARALKRSGLPGVYESTNSGGNLYGAANWLVAEMTERPNSIGWNSNAPGSRSIAWLEQLVAENPTSPELTLAVRQGLEHLSRPRFVAFAGGPVTCLYGHVD